MKATFPHMGNSHIVFKSIADALGVDYIIPPPTGKTELNYGVKHSPEFVCLPFKMNLGNFITALEAGADTLFMAGGIGTCRFGYYAKVQEQILRDLGYKFDMIILNQLDIFEVYRILKKMTNKKSFLLTFLWGFCMMWQKSKLIARLEKQRRKVAPYEMIPGATKMVYEEGLKIINDAENLREIRHARKKIGKMFSRLKADKSRKPLKIAILGEIYTVLEPYVSMELEEKLLEMGVELHCPFSLYKWLKHIFRVDLFGPHAERKVVKWARPHLKYNPGGEGQNNVGYTLHYAEQGFDGIIHIYPFTCMPGVITHTVLNNMNKEYGIPVLNYSLDEQMSKSNFYTRIEAFVDLLERKRK
jgi:predicted nucleotide-binding protein (sugar kinase/HSP70/actin superfamily)